MNQKQSCEKDGISESVILKCPPALYSKYQFKILAYFDLGINPLKVECILIKKLRKPKASRACETLWFSKLKRIKWTSSSLSSVVTKTESS